MLAKDRHRSSLIILKGREEEMICVAPGQGDRQGDGPAPQKFIVAYDKMTKKLVEKETSFLDEMTFSLREPITMHKININ
eukprot:5323843-Heterocapsa_arctica.AAC.1